MTEEKDDEQPQQQQQLPQEEDLTRENLMGAGQRILGNLEMIGGIITGDPVTTAEGEFNDDVGKIHQDSARALSTTEHESEEK